ncbi:hypothetical protein TSUD_66060 [Trifolium subterraneum]|uniref:CCHC-type domain-containing protein n=1 Tax=Trifolium subterraneum TaxID=3900 RepID=A0A2Z6NVX5_TRISU|nr:hypothetical protein TSUD_66060 [Trifolium subterraneum]
MTEINFESLNLDEEEDLNLVVEEDIDEEHDLNLCLVGRFVHDRPIRFNSMKACLADVWRPVKGMTVKEATQGLYLFKFFHPLDVEEVLKVGPWTFDSFTLIIDRLKIGVALQDIPLFHVNFWVQIHNVPLGMMLETVGKGLANYIGKFVEYDKNNNTSFWRKYIRVKVRVDVRSPLKIGRKIKLNGGNGGVVKFKYEKLGLFCFVCGRLGHAENKCEVKYAMERDDGRRSWSNEIKAEVRRPGGERGSHQTGPTQTNVAPPRESSSGPENGEIVSTVRGYNHSLRPSGVGHPGSIQGPSIEAPAVSLIANRPLLAITNDNDASTTQSWQFPGLSGLMIILSWNCRGLGGPSAIPNLKKLARGHKPDILFLSETLSHNRHIESLRVMLGFDSCLAIDVEGRSGVEDEQCGEWRLTCYYGYPERSRRRAAWDLLRDLDIPIEGHPFTWIKSRGTPHVIEERTQVNNSFRFENSWLKEPDLEDVVVEGWGGRENLEVVDRVARCANKLQSMQYQELSERHATLLLQEEGYWKQRAKMHWLQEADMNTRFFHMSATAHSKQKKVTKLIADNGTEAHAQEELCEVAKSYFDTLFKPRDGDYDPVLNLIQPRVTDDDNFFLTAPITKVEIQKRCFRCIQTNLLDPTGLIQLSIRGFGNSVDLRPISLCNVLYKMISKVLANRLKCCLDKCVSQEQSAFVEGRSIIDNALIAIEVIHALKRKIQGRTGELALKIDISKVYGKVDWGFLRGVMTKMGFSDVWIRWVMMCVSSVNYSVLMNYDRVGPISPGRGLRQGDPLSPYLFILVTECLTALIHRAVGRGDLHGVRVCRGAPEVSHLLFADDCFLFCRANVAEVNELMRILHTYEQASGQEINLGKSEVFILGVRLVLGTGIYLGLPSMVGRSKKTIFSYIKDRIWKRINSWRGRALSKAGKEVMIKSVLQAIPSYVMSMFILPTSLIADIEKMINAFWWRGGNNNNNNNKGIHWLAWDRLACPKAHGGLGFRNFEAFNKAVVAKQVWNIVQNPDSLVAKLIKTRYFPHSSLFEAPLGYNPSFVWRSMWHARQILSLGCRWRIGSGVNIRVMHDPWLRGSADRWMPSPQSAGVYQLSVRDLLHENYKAWNITKVRNLFSGDVVKRIMETPLVSSVREDKVVWEEERNECYSVKYGYKLAMRYIIGSEKYHVAGNWNGIWKAQAPHKARHLLRRLCRGCLPTRYRLLERRVECNLNCPVCDEEMEDELRIFCRCAVARDSWCAAGLSSVLHNAAYQQTNARDRIFAVCSNERSDTVGRVTMLLWCIWHNRNDKLWNDNAQMPRQLGRYAFDAWNDWYSVHKLQRNSVSGTIEADLVKWEKPALGWVKCNVDAAFLSGSGKTSVGVCFRDNRGHLMAGMTQWQQTVLSPVEGEAWALLLAMEEARHRGLDRVQFESDSKVLVEAIHMKRRGNSEFLSIVCDILSLMSSFLNFEVKFVRRQANSVAHTLARAANSWSSLHRFEIIPLCIEHLIVNEMQ